MSETQLIQQTPSFQSIETLKQDLIKLGVKAGDNLIIHSSLKSLGWVAGGPHAVVQALLEAVGNEGTIVMPAQSADNSEPSYWMNPPVPEEWYDKIRAEWPAYNPKLTPTRSMGRIVETFHRHQDVIRSPHPAHSFMAWGKHAEEWMREHTIGDSFGETSPLRKMEEAGCRVLLIGVGYDSCTALHLAEYRQETLSYSKQGAAMMVDGKREWVEFDMLDTDSDRFVEIGKEYEELHPDAVTIGNVGQAECRLMEMKPLIAFGVEWLKDHPAEEIDLMDMLGIE